MMRKTRLINTIILNELQSERRVVVPETLGTERRRTCLKRRIFASLTQRVLISINAPHTHTHTHTRARSPRAYENYAFFSGAPVMIRGPVLSPVLLLCLACDPSQYGNVLLSQHRQNKFFLSLETMSPRATLSTTFSAPSLIE